MAYPYQIVAFDGLSQPYSQPPIRRTDSVLYKSILGGTNPNWYIAVYKSTDAGVTWAEVDAAGHPTSGRLDYQPFNCFDDGTRLWFVYNPGPAPHPPTESNVKAFNTSTDLWETTITGGPLPSDPGSPSTSANILAQLGIVVRSNGDKVVFYSGSTMFLAGFATIRAKVYNGSWSAAIDVLIPGTTESDGTAYNYSFLGAVLGSSDKIHIFAWSDFGYVYITLNSDNSVANYTRMDITDTLDLGNFRDGGYFGESRLVTYGGASYAALPHGMHTAFEGESNHLLPGLILVPDADPTGAWRFDYMGMNYRIDAAPHNWISVCVAYDSSTGVTYLLWTDTTGNLTTIRISCSRGYGWSTPSTLFVTASGDLIESMEAVAAGGVVRAVFENSAGNTPYSRTHYFQGEVSCAGGAAVVAANFAFLGEG